MEAAPAAIPVKPNNAAISAITKNTIVQRNIVFRFSEQISLSHYTVQLHPVFIRVRITWYMA